MEKKVIMPKKIYLVFILIFLLLFYATNLISQELNQNVIEVDLNGTGDYESIQDGIYNSSDGDLVLVHPGTYYENVNFYSRNITLASKFHTTGDESYIDSTIIDGNESGGCIALYSGEDNCRLIGFTLQNGSGVYDGYSTYGGGIYTNNYSSLSVEFCNIINNYAAVGGGIFSNECPSLNIIGTNIIGNHANT